MTPQEPVRQPPPDPPEPEAGVPEAPQRHLGAHSRPGDRGEDQARELSADRLEKCKIKL